MRRALADWGWLVSLLAVVLALFAVYIALPLADVETRVDRSIDVPRDISEIQPQEVACKGAVSVVDSPQGFFYRSVLGDYVLSWTRGLDKTVLTAKSGAVDYPVADKAITRCLIERAKPVVPSQ